MTNPKGVRYGGRAKGTPNKATADIKALAQEHAPKAIAELARLVGAAESEQARVAAIKELLDRGYGRPVQPLEAKGQIEVVIVDPSRRGANVDAKAVPK
jgi:hypothetical protein